MKVNWLRVRQVVVCPKTKGYIELKICEESCEHRERILIDAEGREHVLCKYDVESEAEEG